MEQPGLKDDSEYSLAARSVLVMVFAIIASLTALTHLAQLIGLSFRIYAWVGIVLIFIVAFILSLSDIRYRFHLMISRPKLLLALIVLCSTAAIFTLVCHRPEFDDVWYVPNVVHYLTHPDESMGIKVYFWDSGDEQYTSFHLLTSQAFDYMRGIAAFFLNVPFLAVYHIISPVFIGFLIPLVWFYAISRFSFSQRACVIGATVICFLLPLMGELNQTYGNYAFNRIFQGKAVLISFGVPFYAALTMDFFRRPSLYTWLCLFSASVALAGVSPSSVVLIGSLALVLAVACSLAYRPNIKSGLAISLAYFCSLIYLVGYAVTVKIISLNSVGPDSNLLYKWKIHPKTFLGHARFYYASPFTFCLLALGTFYAIKLLKNAERRFLILWIVILVIIFINPLVAPFIMKYLTSPLIYWRLFFIYPFPLVLGIVAAYYADRLDVGTSRRGNIIFFMVILLTIVPHFALTGISKYSPSIFHRGNTRLKLTGCLYNIKQEEYDQAQLVKQIAPPGTMLATLSISNTLPKISGIHPQFVMGNIVCMTVMMTLRGTPEEAQRRFSAAEYLDGSNAQGRDDFLWLIHNYSQIQSIVMRDSVAENRPLPHILRSEGFSRRQRAGPFIVFSKE